MINSMELMMKDILYCFIPLYLSGILCNAFCSLLLLLLFLHSIRDVVFHNWLHRKYSDVPVLFKKDTVRINLIDYSVFLACLKAILDHVSAWYPTRLRQVFEWSKSLCKSKQGHHWRLSWSLINHLNEFNLDCYHPNKRFTTF